MNFANAIRPKMKRHSTTNMTKLFVGVGRLSGTLAVGSIGPIVAWNSALALTRLAQPEAQKAPKRDGDHGSPCPVLAISTQSKKGHAMIPAIFALGLATGIALTTAFALGLLPLLLI